MISLQSYTEKRGNVSCTLPKKCPYSGPYFLAFVLNTKRYGVSLRIKSKCGKIRTRITPNTDSFHAVVYINVIMSKRDCLPVKLYKFFTPKFFYSLPVSPKYFSFLKTENFDIFSCSNCLIPFSTSLRTLHIF